MTNRKPKKKDSENDNLMERLANALQKRSANSLEAAKKLILSNKLECKEINEAFEYYAKNWNDYIHPGLISIACEAVNGNPDNSTPVQVAMLLLNAAFDMHDDIIDESKTKHGKLTVLGKFGKDVALLVGDALLIKALTHLHKLEQQYSTQKTSAIWDVVNNQFFESGDAEALEASLKGNVDIFPEKCIHILEKKASNFDAHMRIGAIIGDGKKDEIEILGNYGRTLGILTFIREDFIDIFEPDELKNRTKNELLPLPILHAFKNPHTRKTIMNILSKPKISDKDAEKIVDVVFEDEAVKVFQSEMKRLAEKASASMSGLPNQDIRFQMQKLLVAVLEDL